MNSIIQNLRQFAILITRLRCCTLILKLTIVQSIRCVHKRSFVSVAEMFPLFNAFEHGRAYSYMAEMFEVLGLIIIQNSLGATFGSWMYLVHERALSCYYFTYSGGYILVAKLLSNILEITVTDGMSS